VVAFGNGSVVETAPQAGAIIAEAGPSWTGLHPGSFSKTVKRRIHQYVTTCGARDSLTSTLSNFVDLNRLRTRIHLSVSLEGKTTLALTGSWVTEDISAAIHGALKCIAFPAEHVVTVVSEARPFNIERRDKNVVVSITEVE
jgi:hypothetical protein